MGRIKAGFLSVFVVLGFGLGLFLIYGCNSSPNGHSDFLCALPGGIQQFTSPQAQWRYFPGGKALEITNPGTGQQIRIPYMHCIEVYTLNE